jgi:hypothetical protein
MLSFLNKIFKRKPKYTGNYKKEVVYVFTCKGIDYFTFADVYQTPYQRLILAGYFQDMALRGYHSETVISVVDSVLKQMDSNSIDISSIYNNLSALKNKMNTRFDLDALLNVGTCMFITNDEDAYGYSVIYNQAKINDWKEMNPDSFFLIIRLVAQRMLSRTQEKDLVEYLETGLASQLKFEKETGLENWSKFLLNLRKTKLNYKAASLATLI